MRATRRLAALLAALTLAAAPTAAFAQNAGDEQYADPFGNSSQSGSGSSGSGSSGSSGSTGTTGTTGSNSGVAAAQQQGTPSATAAAGTAAGQSTAAAGELPRTGLDVGIVAAVGAALLLGGLALRRRSADARR